MLLKPEGVDRTDYLIDAQADRRYPRKIQPRACAQSPVAIRLVYWYDIWAIVLEAKQSEQQ
jgi:hypothetical protein